MLSGCLSDALLCHWVSVAVVLRERRLAYATHPHAVATRACDDGEDQKRDNVAHNNKPVNPVESLDTLIGAAQRGKRVIPDEDQTDENSDTATIRNYTVCVRGGICTGGEPQHGQEAEDNELNKDLRCMRVEVEVEDKHGSEGNKGEDGGCERQIRPCRGIDSEALE